MPSPVGHTLTGLCGFLVAQRHVVPRRRGWLLVGSVVTANLPDLDFLPGLLLGNPAFFHHQATHSLAAVVIVSVLIGSLASWWNLNGIRWGTLGGGLYLSHVVLDLLINDLSSPFGVQLFWPFSKAYFISTFTPFSGFAYFDPALGMLRSILSVYNLRVILWEIVLLAPLVALAWYVGRYRGEALGR